MVRKKSLPKNSYLDGTGSAKKRFPLNLVPDSLYHEYLDPLHEYIRGHPLNKKYKRFTATWFWVV